MRINLAKVHAARSVIANGRMGTQPHLYRNAEVFSITCRRSDSAMTIPECRPGRQKKDTVVHDRDMPCPQACKRRRLQCKTKDLDAGLMAPPPQP